MTQPKIALPESRVVELSRPFGAGEERIPSPRGPWVASTRILRGRVTQSDVRLLVRIEGTPRQIEETLGQWRNRSFRVTFVPREMTESPEPS